METVTSPFLQNQFLAAFDDKMFKEARLNIFFFSALFLESLILLIFLPFFLQSALVSFVIALFIATLFGFGLLKQYLAAQKHAYFKSLISEYGELAKKEMGYQEREAKHHVQLAKFYTTLADRLYQREFTYYSLPSWANYLTPWIERVSGFLHSGDLMTMREFLLKSAVDEHVNLVRRDPVNCEAHALLANAYVQLSGLYWDENQDKKSNLFKPKFIEAAQKAVEEFNILKEYAPKDPWVYTQLAYSYRDLKMPKEEKEAYEMLLELRPNDHDTRFKLGTLYFRHGETAKGLKIYEELKKGGYNKAEELLSNYGGRATL